MEDLFPFEWDDAKAAINFEKHGVSFWEASSVFKDPLSVTIRDPDFSERFVDLGLSDRQRLLVVVYCERGARLRIISAREAEKHERKDYENG